MLRLISGFLLIAALVLSILAYEKTEDLEKKIALSQPGLTNLLIKKDLQDALQALDKGKKEEARKCIERALDRMKEEGNPPVWDELNKKIDNVGKNIQDIWKYIYKGEKK